MPISHLDAAQKWIMVTLMQTAQEFVESYLRERLEQYEMDYRDNIAFCDMFYARESMDAKCSRVKHVRVPETVLMAASSGNEAHVITGEEQFPRLMMLMRLYRLRMSGGAWKIFEINPRCGVCGGSGLSNGILCASCNGSGWIDEFKWRNFFIRK